MQFGEFFVIVFGGIIVVGLLIGLLFRPREDPYALRIPTGPSELGVPVDPDEQALAAAMAIRTKTLRSRKFARELARDKRGTLLAAGVPEAMLDLVIKKLGELQNDVDARVERRVGVLVMDWKDHKRSDDM